MSRDFSVSGRRAGDIQPLNPIDLRLVCLRPIQAVHISYALYLAGLFSETWLQNLRSLAAQSQ